MSAREIELKFEGDRTEIEIKAEIEDGHLKTRADFETDTASSDDD